MPTTQRGEQLDLSVVVPTYNRKERLQRTVAYLRDQSYAPDRYEIVIVSDGSTDGTDELFATPLEAPRTRLLRQERAGFGAGVARNRGLQDARGEVVLFLDDDMEADRQLVEAHVRTQRARGPALAICGRIRLSEQLLATPFGRTILSETGPTPPSRGEEEECFVPFQAALSGHISFRRAELLALGGFEEGFDSYGWEDLELAYRAAQAGIRFYYQPQAVSTHHDYAASLSLHCRRLRRASRLAPALFARQPGLKPLVPMFADKDPVDWRLDPPRLVAKKLLRQLAATQPVLRSLEVATPLVEMGLPWRSLLKRWYYGIIGCHVLAGYHEGLREAAIASSGKLARPLTGGARPG